MSGSLSITDEGITMSNKFDGKALTEKRKADNAAILAKLTQYLSDNPDMRFSQALRNLNIIQVSFHDQYPNYDYWKDEYYLEPGEILKRMKV